MIRSANLPTEYRLRVPGVAGDGSEFPRYRLADDPVFVAATDEAQSLLASRESADIALVLATRSPMFLALNLAKNEGRDLNKEYIPVPIVDLATQREIVRPEYPGIYEPRPRWWKFW